MTQQQDPKPVKIEVGLDSTADDKIETLALPNAEQSSNAVYLITDEDPEHEDTLMTVAYKPGEDREGKLVTDIYIRDKEIDHLRKEISELQSAFDELITAYDELSEHYDESYAIFEQQEALNVLFQYRFETIEKQIEEGVSHAEIAKILEKLKYVTISRLLSEEDPS